MRATPAAAARRNASAAGAQGAERLLGRGDRTQFAQGPVGAGAAVMIVDHRRLAGCHQGVLGDDLVAVEHLDSPIAGDHLHGVSDQRDRHRVAGRADTHTSEAVDFTHSGPADPRSQRRQRCEQFDLSHQADSRDRA
jgi:hypothetical protein